MYEFLSSVYTSKKSFSLVDKLPPDKYTSSSSGLYHLKRRTPSHGTVNHDFVKDNISPCVFRKRVYHRLCGTSLYEVSKYSYDDENEF